MNQLLLFDCVSHLYYCHSGSSGSYIAPLNEGIEIFTLD